MFKSHKWGYISVTEMGLCFRHRNGAMFSDTEMGLCFSCRNGAMFQLQKCLSRWMNTKLESIKHKP